MVRAIRFWVLALLLAMVAVAAGEAGQAGVPPGGTGDGATPSGSPSPAAPPAGTPPQMPDLFGGPIEKRAKLTGNWAGVRNEMAMKGVIAELDLTTVFQHQAFGGAQSQSVLRGGPGKQEDDAELMSLGDIFLVFDMNRTGLWKDGIFKFRAQGRFGDSAIFRNGSLLPNNVLAFQPTDDIDEEIFDITEFTYTHFIIPKFALFGGVMNTLDADLTPFSGNTRGKSDFLHSDLNLSTVSFQNAPYKTVGGGFVAMPHQRVTLISTVFNRKEMSGHGPFDRDSYHGVGTATELYVSHSLFRKPGGQMFGFNASCDDALDLAVRPLALIFDAISSRPPNFPDPVDLAEPQEKKFSWAITYNAWQYIDVFEGGPPGWSPLMPASRPSGWGVFLRAAVSDHNPNPLAWNLSGGFGGNNPARKSDTWGVGAFHRSVSDVLLLERLHLGAETGFEAFYNAQITPWFHVTADLQYIDTGLPNADNGLVLGLRSKIDF
ncbi:MAG: hypothetical protein AMXMBFR7_40730 [Planctomycetota bacterium]